MKQQVTTEITQDLRRGSVSLDIVASLYLGDHGHPHWAVVFAVTATLTLITSILVALKEASE